MLGGVEFRDRVGRYYIKQMMTVLGDATLTAREQGGVALASVSFDAEYSGDKVSVDGETSCGPEYISPLMAEFAARASDSKHDGRVGMTDGGARLDFEIPSAPQIPSLRGTHRIFDGDVKRRYGVLSNSWAEKSQENNASRSGKPCC